jgi:hypothetical protein
MPARLQGELVSRHVTEYDDFWRECYRPATLSSLPKIYSFKLSAMPRFVHDRQPSEKNFDFSPFVRRLDPHKHHGHGGGADSPDKKPARKGVKIVAPQEEFPAGHSAGPSLHTATESHHRQPIVDEIPGILRERSSHPEPRTSMTAVPFKPADRTQTHLWTLEQFHAQSLHPHVSEDEVWEYERYIAHPLNVPLVVSSEEPSDANIDFIEYVAKAGGMAYGMQNQEDGEDAEVFTAGISDADLQAYYDFVEEMAPEPLTVNDDDYGKKRYKAYRQWLKGKSLFKQNKLDPEFRLG